jgi:hypothetical protein
MAEDERVAKFCSQCGASLAPSMKFCGECGAEIDQNAASTREQNTGARIARLHGLKLSTSQIFAVVGGLNAVITLIVSIHRNSVTLYLIGYWALLVTLCLWIAIFATGFLVVLPLGWVFEIRGKELPDKLFFVIGGPAYVAFAIASLVLILPTNGPSSTDSFGKITLSVLGWLILLAPVGAIAYLQYRQRLQPG